MDGILEVRIAVRGWTGTRGAVDEVETSRSAPVNGSTPEAEAKEWLSETIEVLEQAGYSESEIDEFLEKIIQTRRVNRLQASLRRAQVSTSRQGWRGHR